MGRIIGITGIDTGIGKTYVTGLLARVLNNRGIRVITAKAVQTGSSTQIAEDILQHRRLMGIPLQKEDEAGLTCPYSYRLPASPQLAAREEGETIDPSKIASCLTTLAHAWDIVLVEGAGGLLVPLTDRYTFLSFFQEYRIPVCLVTSARLGSINHTWLTMEMLLQHDIEVLSIFYNLFPPAYPPITEDSYNLFSSLWPTIPIVRIPYGDDPRPIEETRFAPVLRAIT
ncbi:Dethiobiotin synthetase [Spirochaeta thermophila DSM 6578]|uniref:ATP-dependent dethiobiotin synthetase BioD n=1 Tax=Winmispira thermophila (strain ATCC 700085 / DSM 6578 / Z-1203) TaxID=869211 RepID=G0GBM4_WINT7|nr:dethiobiotin synthase [Spirochaeta thermophila]AEJ61102.1 Dethiobiotin synthetase [Spirochaeta thermophila DSM 6578]